MSDVLVIVQARPGGTRLPGKINMELSPGESMLYHVCKRAEKIGPVFVATPPPDLDEDDVLGRFWKVAQMHKEAKTFVRITADCPLLDWQFSLSLVDYKLQHPELDYVATSWTLDGLDTEVFSWKALKDTVMWVQRHPGNPSREHVTHWMRRAMPGKEVMFPGQGPFRWSVDDVDGLDFVRRVYMACTHCSRGTPHHSNAANSIGGMDGRAPRWDLHAGEDGGLVECTAYEVRKERMGGEGYRTC